MESMQILQQLYGAARADVTPLAMAYVPVQQWDAIYEAEKGLSRGTIFPALDLPFLGKEPKNHE
ncbi:MAG: spore coat associated protein CotJA [Ruminococcaceae bacterium]|nr:spore coat associated protein CotJA [Oscillospiraceae bacterium]